MTQLQYLEKLISALDYRDNYEKKVQEAACFLSAYVMFRETKYRWAITLGSGLGDLADSIKSEAIVSYDLIPNFPRTTVSGHEGKMIFGTLEGVPVIGLKGRKHYYEVADEPFNTGILQTVFPIHVLAGLGVKNYFVTNAAGGLNPLFEVGSLMAIDSHINLLPNPLTGRHHQFLMVDTKGVGAGERVERFQPMNNAYDLELRNLLLQTREGLSPETYVAGLFHGTYLAVTGPTYETEGESIAFRQGLKADAVGMSTANEVIAARNRGMKVVGLSCITNKIAADGTNATNHEEVKAILESPRVKDRLTNTVRTFFKLYKEKFKEN